MKRKLAFQIGKVLIVIVLFTMIFNAVMTYRLSFNKLYEAAGIEAYGCAFITTGLFNTSHIDELKSGNSQNLAEVEKALNWTIHHKDIFTGQLVLDLDGTVLAADDKAKEQGVKIGEKYPIDEKVFKTVVEEGHPNYSDFFEYNGVVYFSGYAPIYKDHDATKEVIAISTVNFDKNIVHERTMDLMIITLLLAILPLGIATLISTYLLINRKIKPISKLIHRAKEVADGNLTVKEMEIKNNDEIGDLSHSLDDMGQKLRTIISTVRDASVKVNNNAVESSKSVEKAITALQEIAVSVAEVAKETELGKKSASEAANTLSDLNNLIKKAQDKASISQERSVRTLSIAKEGIEKVVETLKDMKEIKLSTEETEKIIQNLSEYTNKIQLIADTITGIAEQTNLLAINASIEAARAGESSRGFAVVAEEIRKLADQSNKEASEVANIIEIITGNTENAVRSVQNSRQLIEKGEENSAITERSLEEILNAVDDIVTEIQQITELTNKEVELSAKMVSIVNRLETVLNTTSVNAASVAETTANISASSEQIAKGSEQVSALTKELLDLVQRFKLEN